MSDCDVLIVQTGCPPRDMRARFGQQGDWFASALAPVTNRVRVVRPAAGEALPEEFGAAIVTGSWSMVTERRDWSERTGQWLVREIDRGQHILGVCYGHQLMADALGGTVGDHPDGREIGRLTVTINHAGQRDSWLRRLPARFPAFLTHKQSVLRPPSDAQVLGYSAHDRYQILRYTERALSVQFHPEFTASLLRGCIERSRDVSRQAQSNDACFANLAPTHVPLELLHRFTRGAVPRSLACGLPRSVETS